MFGLRYKFVLLRSNALQIFEANAICGHKRIINHRFISCEIYGDDRKNVKEFSILFETYLNAYKMFLHCRSVKGKRCHLKVSLTVGYKKTL